MPDFISKINAMKDKRAEIQKEESEDKAKKGSSNGSRIQEQFDEVFGGSKKQTQPKEQSLNFNSSTLDDMNSGIDPQEAAQRRTVANETYGGQEGMVQMNPLETGGWGADAVYQDFISKAGDNIMVGVGNSLLSGTGDFIDGIGASISSVISEDYNGNPISKFLQDAGEDVAKKFETYVSPEMLSPEFKMSTFLNPEFWSVHGAQFVPQLLEILLTKNVAKAGARGLSSLGRKAIMELGEEGAEKLAKRGLLKTTTKSIGGAISEVESNALRMSGKLFRDTGELTSLGKGLVEGGLGGALTNFKVSMQNAGELWGMMGDLKNEDGSPMFTNEERGEAAAAAFANNSKYMAIDMLSWGMTFGGGWNKLSKAVKTLSPASQLKTASGMFVKQNKSLLNKAFSLAQKSIPEGLEETFQESFEEWSKMKAYKDVTGTLKGYPGLSQDYDTDGFVGDFFSYYTSKDSEALRAISFGLGAAAGGVFNVKQVMNESAEQNYAYLSKAENLKQKWEKGTQGKAYQDTHIRNQMAELVFENKDYAFGNFIGELNERGVIGEDETTRYVEMFESMKEQRDNIEFLNIGGKRAFMNNIAKEMDIANKISIEQAKNDRNIATLKATFGEDTDGLNKALLRQDKAYKKQISILGNILAQIQENKRNILKGEPATKVDYETTIDENGNEVYQEPTSMRSEKVEEDMQEQVPVQNMAKSVFNKIKQKGVEALKSVGINIDGEQDEDVTKKEEITNKEEEPVTDTVLEDNPDLEEQLNVLAQQEVEFNKNQPADKTINDILGQSPKKTDNKSASFEADQKAYFDENTEDDVKTKSAKEAFDNGQDGDVYKMTTSNNNARAHHSGEKSSKTDYVIKQGDSFIPVSDIDLDDDAEIGGRKIKRKYSPEDLDKNNISISMTKLKSKSNEKIKWEDTEQGQKQAELKSLLKDKSQADKNIDEEIEKDYDMSNDEEAAIAGYEKKAMKRKSDKKTIAEKKDEELKQALKQKPKKRNTNDDIFGRAKKMEDVGSTEAETEKSFVSTLLGSVTNKFKKFKQSYQKDQENLGGKKRKLKNDLGPIINPNQMEDWLKDSLTIGQEFAVNQKLASMFPDANVHLSIVQDLRNAIGNDVLGYSLMGAVYVDANKWNQDDTFMHEMAHVYFEFMKDDPNTSVVINNVAKNKSLLDAIKTAYQDDIVYVNSKGQKGTYRNALNNALNKGFTEEEFIANFQKQLSEKTIKEAPLEQQDVIREELFAYGLQGPLSKEFGNLISVPNENVRQYLAKKWWQKIKEKAVKSQKEYGDNENVYLSHLAGKDLKEFNTAKEAIFNQFREGLKGRDVELSSVGKKRAIEKYDAEIALEHDIIREKLNKQAEKFDYKKVEDYDTDFEIELEEETEDNEKWFDRDRLKYSRKASELMRKFSRSYNKILRRKYFDSNKNKPVDWKNIETFDRDAFENAIINSAKEAPSNLEFIRRIENSDVKEIEEFNHFLDNVRPDDKYLILSSMKFIYGNQSKVNSLIGYVNEDGTFKIQNNMSAKENSMFERAFDNYVSNAGNWFTQNSTKKNKGFFDFKKAKKYAELISLVEKIKSNDYNNSHLLEFLNHFSVPGIDTNSIFRNGIINVNGNNYTIDQVVREVVRVGFNPKTGQFGNAYDLKDTKGNYKPIYREFIKSLVVTNRKFTNTNTVLNAEGNQVPVRIVDNMFVRLNQKMNEDAKHLGRQQFIRKYSGINNTGKGSLSNPILNHFYDMIQDGNVMDINMYHGTKNDINKNSSTVSNSNSVEQSIMEALTYFSDNRSKEYMMEAGRFADSPVSYMMRVPKTKLNDLGKMVGDKFVFSNQMKSQLENALNVYNNITDSNLSQKEFENVVSEQVQNEIDFFMENKEAFYKTKVGNDIFSKGKLTSKGRNMITEYSVNQILNSLAFNDIFMPSYSGKDIVKRQKSLHSPIFSFGENVRVEPIYYVDKSENGQSLSDSSMYVLREDAELIRKAGGQMMPLNNSYKILLTGREFENEKFKNANLYDKGYATIIDDDYVMKNPDLKGLYEFMKERRQRYNRRRGVGENTGPNTEDLLNGELAHLMFAAPLSSVKSNNIPTKLADKDYNATEQGQLFTFEGLNSSLENGDFEKQNQMYDDWHYVKDDKNNTEEFIGLSGANFGVQQVMDMKKTKANTPIQMMRAILTNASLFDGGIEVAEEIQSLLTQEMQSNLEKYREVLLGKDSQKIREFIINNMSMMDVDSRQRFLIEDDKGTLTLPDLQTLAMNTMVNAIKKKGNKLETPGSIAQAKASTYKKMFSTNGTKDLAFYTEEQIDNGDGTTTRKHRPGETIVPKHLSSKLTARKYYVNRDGNNLDSLFERAKTDMVKRKVKGNPQPVYNDNGEHIGYYSPGDTIIATRIPSHGPQTTGVFEVIDYDNTDAANIQLPSQFALDITGGDYDGDQFFIQHQEKTKAGNLKSSNWNTAYNKLTDLWLSNTMFDEVKLSIDFKEEAEQAVKEIHGDNFDSSKNFHFSPKGRREAYNNTLVSKNNIGVAANIHSLIGMLSGYNTELVNPVRINGREATHFQDVAGESRTINSAKIFNLILDNAKNQYADALGINEHTVSQAMILRNLGFDLTEIGMILNSTPVKEMNKLLSNNANIFKDSKSIADLEKIVRSKLPKKTSNATVDTSKLNDANVQHAVLDLMVQLGSINEDIMAVSAIMSGHNKLDTNPFVLRQQYENFQQKILNKDNRGVSYPSSFMQNPLLQNYVNTFEFNMEVMKEFDPVYNDTGVEIFKRLTEGINRNLTNKDIMKIHNLVQMLMTARSIGLNNVDEDYMKNLIKPSTKENINKKNIFNRLNDYIQELDNEFVDFKQGDVSRSVTAFHNNLLLRKGLRYSLSGNNQYIALNSSFFNENMNSEERNRMIDEFNQLPKALRNDLLIYDMFTNGLKGPNSLFSLMNDGFKMQLGFASDANINMKQNNKMSRKQENLAIKRIAETNSDMFRNINNNYDLIVDGKLNPEFAKKQSSLFNKMAEGKETIFRYNDNGKIKVFHFAGINEDNAKKIGGISESVVKPYLLENIFDFSAIYKANAYKNGIGIIANPDEKTGSPILLDNSEDLSADDMFGDVDNVADLGRNKKDLSKDYYKFTEELSEDEYLDVMEINRDNVSKDKQSKLYKKYLEEKKKADAISKNINSDTVKDMSDEKLIELYSGKKLSDGEAGYGHRDKLAYAKVIRPIILEIAKRSGVEQAQLAKEKSGTDIKYENKDLGFFHSYLMSNNIPSNQPEIQSLVRKMEIEFKKFQKEKSKLTADIQSATTNLYQEQFGFNPNNRGVFSVDFWKQMWNNLVGNKEDFYMKLYGPLIEFQKVKTKSGEVIQNMKYKTSNQIEEDYKKGIISPAQYDFYKATTEMTNKMKPYALGNVKEGRVDYIPHTAPTWLEVKARRGLLGLAVNSKTIDERIYDVRMSFRNPITGKLEDTASFHHIENIYNALSKDKGKNSLQYAKEFTALKKKAILLARKMKNEDGSDLKISEVEAGSAIGDVFMDRFTNSRSVTASDLPSLDLNKAFMDYAHSTLFNHGNDNFKGMNKMIPLVDGVLALSESRNDTNAKNYVDKVWKDYFLGGKKQSTLKNSATLEAVGLSSDAVIDYITKGSLVYWLGLQGLAIGGGVYAIGNILTGKYMNIKNGGSKAWALGEKRFWGGTEGFNPLNPFKGIKEANAILRNLGFMDINVYDEVSVEEKSSIGKAFMNIALFPMIYSEKWIQGVDFLGRLTPEEWNTVKNGGELSENRMTEIENEVKNNHGKGYQATDQRMIQMYSWGRNMLQFSRYIPTLFYDQFASKDINIYGKKHVGSYRAVGDVIQKVVRGDLSPKDFINYRKGLDAYERKRLDQGLIGFGMLSVMWGLDISGSQYGDSGFFADANPLLNLDKMEGKLTPASLDMIDKVF